MEDVTVGGEGQEKKDDARIARRLGVALAIAAIALFLLWLLWPRLGAVPAVIGMDEVQGRAVIEKAGFTIGVVATRTIDTIESGRIVGQLPPAGMRVTLGAVVDYTIAQPSGVPGSETGPRVAQSSAVETGVLVPDVRGKSEADARAALAAVGLASATSFTSSGMAVNQVVHEFPDPGVFLPAGSVIELTVSTGAGMRGSASVGWSGPSVPDVLGVGADTARGRLSAAGYGMRTVYAPSTTTPRGLSFWQSSGPGPEKSPPSVIEVWMSTGPPSTGQYFPMPPDISPASSMR